ncbi:MAG: Crp/Fnr family transcriptional regulator, partial [Candidatus Binatia bacterium]
MDNPELGSLDVLELLVARAACHGALTAADKAAIRALPFRLKTINQGQDVVRQGDHPNVSVFVMNGMLARYHTLPSGDRQYLSFHIAGDLPDVQSLFLKVMDHSLCGLSPSTLALFPHAPLNKLLYRRPSICFALWRLTLTDAAIFRQAITNNSRSHIARLAHLFCEQYFRARENGLMTAGSCHFPVNQAQLGQALGMSHISVNRA